MGGECNGAAFVGRFFDANLNGECRSCMMFCPEEARCEALDGRERLTACPALQERIASLEIELYGINRPPKHKTRCERRMRKRK